MHNDVESSADSRLQAALNSVERVQRLLQAMRVQLLELQSAVSGLGRRYRPNPHDALDVQPGCTMEEVRQAWQLARRVPRDDGEVDEQRTLELDTAYILLVEKLGPEGDS